MQFRKLLFGMVMLAVTYGVMECLSYAMWYYAFGRGFSFADAAQKRDDALQDLQSQNGEQPAFKIASNGTVPHPYLGFVYDPSLSKDPLVKKYGFLAENDPFIASKDVNTAIVAITGGSVAEQFFTSMHQRLHESMEKLPGFQGKKIDVIMLGRGMYHQPQQLFSVSYYLMQGGRLDMLINLDGFNEITGEMEEREQGIYPAFPFAWRELFSGASDPANLPKLGEIVMWKHCQYAAIATFEPLQFSVTASTLSMLINSYCNKNAVLAEEALQHSSSPTLPYFIAGPGTMHDASQKDVLDFAIRMWQQASEQLDALAKLDHFTYFHFLQPDQYVAGSKVLSEEEKKTAYDPKNTRYSHIAATYPLLEAGIAQLRAEGVNAYSLTRIYKSEARTVYRDACCHLNDLGNEIMANAIAGQIAQDIKAH